MGVRMEGFTPWIFALLTQSSSEETRRAKGLRIIDAMLKYDFNFYQPLRCADASNRTLFKCSPVHFLLGLLPQSTSRGLLQRIPDVQAALEVPFEMNMDRDFEKLGRDFDPNSHMC